MIIRVVISGVVSARSAAAFRTMRVILSLLVTIVTVRMTAVILLGVIVIQSIRVFVFTRLMLGMFHVVFAAEQRRVVVLAFSCIPDFLIAIGHVSLVGAIPLTLHVRFSGSSFRMIWMHGLEQRRFIHVDQIVGTVLLPQRIGDARGLIHLRLASSFLQLKRYRGIFLIESKSL